MEKNTLRVYCIIVNACAIRSHRYVDTSLEKNIKKTVDFDILQAGRQAGRRTDRLGVHRFIIT